MNTIDFFIQYCLTFINICGIFLFELMNTTLNQKHLHIPQANTEIQIINGVKYLVHRIEESTKTCEEFANELRKGHPVVVPASKRGHLIGFLKKESIFTQSKTLEPGKWILFTPTKKRKFRS